MASSELPFLEIYDMSIISKVFLSTFTWHLCMTEASDGMINSGLFWKYMIWVSFESVFEYCQMVMMSSCPIAFLVGILDNILGVGNL